MTQQFQPEYKEFCEEVRKIGTPSFPQPPLETGITKYEAVTLMDKQIIEQGNVSIYMLFKIYKMLVAISTQIQGIQNKNVKNPS